MPRSHRLILLGKIIATIALTIIVAAALCLYVFVGAHETGSWRRFSLAVIALIIATILVLWGIWRDRDHCESFYPRKDGPVIYGGKDTPENPTGEQ